MLILESFTKSRDIILEIVIVLPPAKSQQFLESTVSGISKCSLHFY